MKIAEMKLILNNLAYENHATRVAHDAVAQLEKALFVIEHLQEVITTMEDSLRHATGTD